MLEKPTIDELIKKSGKNSYETSLLLAKRARQIVDKRVETDSDEILDPVEVAINELMDGDIEFVDKEELEEREAAKKEEEVEEIELDEE